MADTPVDRVLVMEKPRVDAPKDSPWARSRARKQEVAAVEPVGDRPVRFRVAQPMWFRLPAAMAAALFIVAGIWPAALLHDRAGWLLFALAVVIAAALLGLAHSGRVTLEQTGMSIALFGGDRFLSYRVLSSARIVCSLRKGRHHEDFLELTLTSGERVRIESYSPQQLRCAILTARTAWERAQPDSERPAAKANPAGPYRS
jgi:hypothetical protein